MSKLDDPLVLTPDPSEFAADVVWREHGPAALRFATVIGYMGDPPPEATTLAAWLGGADVERGSAELSGIIDASIDVVVVLGVDHGQEWGP